MAYAAAETLAERGDRRARITAEITPKRALISIGSIVASRGGSD